MFPVKWSKWFAVNILTKWFAVCTGNPTTKDMNWRNTSAANLYPGEVGSQDHYYDHPNTNLFANFSEWFAFLKQKKLRTYFNVSGLNAARTCLDVPIQF